MSLIYSGIISVLAILSPWFNPTATPLGVLASIVLVVLIFSLVTLLDSRHLPASPG